MPRIIAIQIDDTVYRLVKKVIDAGLAKKNIRLDIVLKVVPIRIGKK